MAIAATLVALIIFILRDTLGMITFEDLSGADLGVDRGKIGGGMVGTKDVKFGVDDEWGSDNHTPSPFAQALPHSPSEGSVGPHANPNWPADQQAPWLRAGRPAGWLADPHAKNDWRAGPQANRLHPKAYSYAFRMQADP
jgi:hypothetical protein